MLERPADAMRQYIDAVATFCAYEKALADAAKVRGGMYWHKGPESAPAEQYLVRTTAAGGTNGDMARMDTLEPMSFIRFNRWMSAPPGRDPLKRRQDALQAKAVDEILREYLPHLVKD